MNTEYKKKLHKVVLDTNIIVSALNFGGTPDKVFSLVLHEEIHLVMSPFILEEIKGVLINKIGWSENKAEQAVKIIKSKSSLVNPKEKISVIKEKPSDNRILECAIEGDAKYIISGDKKHILPLKEYKGIKIVTPTEFLSLFGRKD